MALKIDREGVELLREAGLSTADIRLCEDMVEHITMECLETIKRLVTAAPQKLQFTITALVYVNLYHNTSRAITRVARDA